MIDSFLDYLKNQNLIINLFYRRPLLTSPSSIPDSGLVNMMLFVNGVMEGVQCNHVGYWIKDHESAFELLTKLVADDCILQEAILVDGLNRMTVPLEAFDGQPIQVHIRNLQRQWQMLLSTQPVAPSAITKQQLKDWYTHLDTYYDDLIADLGKLIALFEMRKAKLSRYPTDLLRLRLSRQYDLLLRSNRRMYRQTQANRQKNRQRLDNLENEP